MVGDRAPACASTAAGGEAKEEHVIRGRTMGTTYHIKVVTGAAGSVTGLKGKIDRRLAQINQVFSTYIKDSEISRFNAIRDTREKLAVSDDFLRVMLAARDLYGKTGGAWDGTVKPLLNLWGFGNTQETRHVPDEAEIKKQIEQLHTGLLD